jgi:hypothetical protein
VVYLVVLIADLKVVFNPPRTTSSAASAAPCRFCTRTVLAKTPEPLDPVEIMEVDLLDWDPNIALAYWVGSRPFVWSPSRSCTRERNRERKAPSERGPLRGLCVSFSPCASTIYGWNRRGSGVAWQCGTKGRGCSRPPCPLPHFGPWGGRPPPLMGSPFGRAHIRWESLFNLN